MAIVGKHRHRRQLIHRAVRSKLVQCDGCGAQVASQESIVGERQAHEPFETPCGETAGLVGRQRLWVGIAARSDELHGGLAVILARGDSQHAAGQLSHPRRVDAAASPQLPAVGTRPGGAHARSCVLGEPERAEELGQQVRRQQDIHAPRWERRHLGDEGVGLVLELGRALAGIHGELQQLLVRELREARSGHARSAHVNGRETGLSRRAPLVRSLGC
eukprot:scaffold7516_cov81-Phaeocystis_antarctica.AAC.3